VVWASFIAAASVFLVCEMNLFIGYNVSLPWTMFSYLTAGLVTGIVTGLVTKPQPKEQLDRFYTLLKTPVDKEEHLDTDRVED
jgi:hypothetical protein